MLVVGVFKESRTAFFISWGYTAQRRGTRLQQRAEARGRQRVRYALSIRTAGKRRQPLAENNAALLLGVIVGPAAPLPPLRVTTAVGAKNRLHALLFDEFRSHVISESLRLVAAANLYP